MRVILLICLFAAAALAQMPKIEPGVWQELAKWRAVQYSNISYKLNLTLEKMSPVLKGSIEIHVTQAAYACAEPNCPRLNIVLDWRKIPGHEKDSTISNVTINGVGAARDYGSGPDLGAGELYLEENDHLIFGSGVRMGENVIKLDFTSPILTSGSAITRYIDKEDGAEYIYSLFVPSDASTVFPCFDQPDLKARFRLNVVGPPSNWKVVSNTESEHWSIDGANPWNDSWNFPETKPISTYVFAFAAGPFEEFNEKTARIRNIENQPTSPGRTRGSLDFTSELSPDPAKNSRIFVRKSQAKKFEPHALEVFRLTREGIKYLETYFDYKFPFPKLDLVLIPEFPFGGMEHAGAIFLREDRVIFPAEPTKGDYLTRANLIFHETAHQWFGDTVTMKWFDDLWLKEGFAEFMAYKTLEKVMPDANAWKVFYERNKQAAYLTDSTRGTTPIYQPIANLSAAKSAYGNIVYRKAPSFLRQAEFYLGEDKFQTAVRAFLKKHEFANAGWKDLVVEFENATKFTEISKADLNRFAAAFVNKRGVPRFRLTSEEMPSRLRFSITQENALGEETFWLMHTKNLLRFLPSNTDQYASIELEDRPNSLRSERSCDHCDFFSRFIFPNYGDYGYGIFLLDDKSRDYVLKNIQNEKDPFLRSMMWGSLWDSVREAELDPKDYVELAIKNLPAETDETIVSSILSRVSTAMNYYVSAAQAEALAPRLEGVLLDRLQHAPAAGQRITFYRAFVANATTEKGREVLKQMLAAAQQRTQAGSLRSDAPPLRTKDKFDIVTRLAILGDADAPKLLAELEKTETSDDAKRYAYAAHAAFGTAENKTKFFNDFLGNKNISESWIESAAVPFNAIRQAGLTQQYLPRAMNELPILKRTRKIFFINNWLAAFIGGQRDQQALDIINKFLADNPNLDNDLRLKVLENLDLIERAVKIRTKYPAK